MSRTDAVFQRILADGIAARDVIALNAEKFLARAAANIDATPRASWHAGGVGFWVVRSRAPDGYILQGVGLTQSEAWEEWRELDAVHVRGRAPKPCDCAPRTCWVCHKADWQFCRRERGSDI